MMKNFKYNDIYSRNYGIFSNEEIQRIKEVKVAIVGAGALGGAVAVMLARLGVNNIRISDPERFDVSNINRQFCAYIDTVNEYKVIAVKNELKRINPYIKVETDNQGINKESVKSFINDMDVIVDGIDFFEIDMQRILYKEARKKKLWCHTAQAAGSLFTIVNFNPVGVSYDELINKNNPLRSAIKFFFPCLPKEATPEMIDMVIKNKEVHLTSYSVPPPIGASYVVNELIKKHISLDTVLEAPNVFVVDIGRMNMKKI